MKKKRSTKLLLDTYYGADDANNVSNKEDVVKECINNNNEPEEEAHVSEKELDELDKKDFDVNKYLGRVLGTLPLCDLLGEEQRLGSEARTLDGEMKTLVYQNYHKFVIATNTVDAMHRNVGTIENELQKLDSDVSTAGGCIASISAGLDAKCARLRHLRSVEAHLSRLRFAADLPHKMRQCLAMGTYHEAVEYYLRTAALFENNRTLPSFAKISAECSSIIDELKKRLWEELTVASAPKQLNSLSITGRDVIFNFARTFPNDRVVDAAIMLIELGEPKNNVQEAFLNISYLNVAFKAALESLTLSKTATEAEASSNVFFGLLTQAHDGYIRSSYSHKKDNKDDNDNNNDDDDTFIVDNIIDYTDLKVMLNKGAEDYIFTLQKWLTKYAQSGPSPLPLTENIAFLERLHARARQTATALPRITLPGHIACVAGDFLGLLVDRVFCDALDSAISTVIPLINKGCASNIMPVKDSEGSEFFQFWENVSVRAAKCVTTALTAAISEVHVLVDNSTNKSFEDCIPDLAIRVHSEVQRFFFKLKEKLNVSISSYYNPMETPFT